MDNCYAEFVSKMIGGLCLILSKEVTISVISSSKNHIDSIVNWEGKTWRFTGFYGFSKPAKKKESWDLIRNLSNVNDIPWLIGSDFNEILWSNEKDGGHNRDDKFMHDFRSCLGDCWLKRLRF